MVLLGRSLFATILAVTLAVLVGQPIAHVAARSLTAIERDKRLFEQGAAATYLDELFSLDKDSARRKVGGEFTKRSNIAVVYMCFRRKDIIQTTLTSLLLSDGISDYDIVISQDGGDPYVIEDEELAMMNSLYIKHPTNLCTGLHHYFVKKFAFEVLGYDAIMVVEEDNNLHPQALQMLKGMLDMTVDDPAVGLVSITDMDNSLLVEESRYASAVLRAAVAQGHLWVYAMHASRYQAVRQHLDEYYDIIKGKNYRSIDLSPLKEELVQLYVNKGYAKNAPLSQDAFFVRSLAKEGYTQRLTTLVRLFEPMGWEGLHFHQDPSMFYGLYGKGMYEGVIRGEPYEVTKNPTELANLETDCRERLDRAYGQYLGRLADERAANTVVVRLLTGKLNAVELVRNMITSAEHRRRMKRSISAGLIQ